MSDYQSSSSNEAINVRTRQSIKNEAATYPLPKLLGCFGKSHVGGEGRVDNSFSALDANDAVQVSSGIIEKANINR